MHWNQEKINLLIKLWEEGKSGNDISHIINKRFKENVSRNAVIGKAYRLKLKRRESPIKKRIKYKKKPKLT